jgi:GT2 family glycosyltransferase
MKVRSLSRQLASDSPHGATTPLVSVVMSVYNGEKYLSQAIDSVLAQTYTNLELIIVDDGSVDSTAQVLRTYASDCRVRTVHQENSGYVRAWNLAIRLARGPIIARMDADDICMPTRLERQLEVTRQYPNWGVIATGIATIDDAGNVTDLHRDFHRHGNIISDYTLRLKLMHFNPLPHPTAIIRRDVLELVGGYSEQYYPAEDYHLWVEIARAGYGLYRVNSDLLYYRIHESSTSATLRELQANQHAKVMDLARSHLLPQLASRQLIRESVSANRCLDIAARCALMRDINLLSKLAQQSRAIRFTKLLYLARLDPLAFFRTASEKMAGYVHRALQMLAPRLRLGGLSQ